jgi:hypothetical protein
MHLLPVKACALLHDELHDQGAMPLHTAAVTAEVPFQQRFGFRSAPDVAVSAAPGTAPEALRDAVLARDYPVIQAMILLTSGIYVAVNLLIDVAYTLLDPRIRY